MIFHSYAFTFISFPKTILCLMFHWRSGAKKWVRGIVIAVVQSLSRVQLFVTPWIAACQASLSFTISWNLHKLVSTESVIPFNHFRLCHPFFFLPSLFSNIRVFSNKSALCIRWPKYWSFSFSLSPFNEYLGLISLGCTGWICLQSKGLSKVFSNTTVQRHQFLCNQLSL